MSERTVIIATIMRPEGETGVQTHINAFVRYLSERGRRYRVVTPFSCHMWVVVPVFGVRLVLDRLSGTASVRWYRYWHFFFLKKALRRTLGECAAAAERVVIYAQCPLSAKAAREACPAARPKVVMVTHFNISQAEEWAGKGKIRHSGAAYTAIRALERDVISSVDGIVYVSRFMQEAIERDIPGARRVPSRIIPNFVWRPSRLPAAGGVRGDLVTIGTLEPRKNQAYLLGVLARAKEKGKVYSLTVIGGGPDLPRLQALARSLGLGEQVTFTGSQKDAARSIPGHRAYCHAALVESFTIAIIEAMACGLPILAGRVGGIPEVFSDGVEGFFWPLDDVSAAADILIRLLEEKPLYERMAAASGLRFTKELAAGVVAGGLLLFLDTV